MGDSQRVEPRWRCIKEGEVSPYKIALCLFIRENFLVSPLLQIFSLDPVPVEEGEDEEEVLQKPHVLEKSMSPRTLLLIYRLITANDMTFSKMKALIEDPAAQVRPEVLRKFMKIISNLEDGNVSFLHELFHSVIDFKSSQIVVLRKKVEKNSPFGKFLRMVLMNVRRMTYPQIHYLYRQLCIYVGEFVKNRKKSVGVIPSEQIPRTPSSLGSSTPTTPASSKGEEMALYTPGSSGSTGTVLQDVWPTSVGSSKSFKSASKLAQQQPNPAKFRGLEIFQRMADRGRKLSHNSQGLDIFVQYTTEYKRATGKWSLSQERDLHKINDDKRRIHANAVEARKSLRSLWKQNPLLRTASQASLDNICDMEYSGVGRPAAKRRSSGRPVPVPALRTLPPRSPRKSRQGPPQILQELNAISERDESYLPSDEEELMGPPSTPNVPTTPKSPRGKSKSRVKSGKKSVTLIHVPETPPGELSPRSGSSCLLGDTPRANVSMGSDTRLHKEIPASKRWDQIKWWSRKQIERALKELENDLVNTSNCSYTPKEISTFVEMAIQNPSAQILLSQIFFIEYVNCLRLKDIRRCTEALRTSFDIRIKPNTSELNKGVPYAPYNFAVFFNFLGYKKDAILCLEEAFRAGHAAADPTCLHYCHNMWSYLQNKPYTDAIVTVTKEVDNNMAYLHSLNVIANAFDYHYQRQPPEEVLYTLWHYNAECHLEEMESLLLLSLSGFFMAFGWHEMVAFPCQIILNSRLNWPLKAYCKALVILSDSLLLRGETEIPIALMQYGESLFGHDASPVGEFFYKRHAIFKAFLSYLAYSPVDESVLATLYAFDRIEGIYWLAYTKMIGNEWEEASNLLNTLSALLLEDETSCENNDMKIRCLLLMAELQCLSAAPAAALGYIYEALDIAYSFCADHFITLCLSHIASIQCEMGLAMAASKTIHKEMRCVIRSSNPFLNARLNVVTVRITIQLQPVITKLAEKQLMDKLNVAEELYKNWNNSYRLQEVYSLKADLLDKCEDTQVNGNQYRKLLDSTNSYLTWSPSACLL